MAINIPIVSEFNNAGLKKAQREFERLEKTSQKVGFALKKAFLPASAALGGLAAAAIPAINAASDLEESMSKVGVIFGEGAKEVEAFAETAAKALGQSKQDVLEAAGTFGTFGKAAGLAGTDLAQFSNDMTALASDVASFNNAEPDEVIEAMGAALRGEAEPMRRFGVLLNDAVLKQEALALGIYDGNGALNDQQKILAAQRAIFKQTGDAQGDFARTSEGLANQTRIMKAQFEDVKAELGKALLPIVLRILPVFADLADFVSNNTELILTLGAVIGGLSAAIVVANFAMKAWAVTQAIATAAQWAFNAALTMNPIGLLVIAIAGLVAALVILYNKVDWVRDLLNKFLEPLQKVADGIGWLAEKLGLVSSEMEDNFTPTTDKAREAAGDMYASVRKAGDGVDAARGQFERAIGPTEDYHRATSNAATETKKLTERVDVLWASTDELYRSMFVLNPELQRYLDQLDREAAVRDFNAAVDEFREIARGNQEGSDAWQDANQRVYQSLADVIEEMGNVPQEVQSELKVLVDTGQLDAAIRKANQLAAALRLARVEAPKDGGVAIPSFSDLKASLEGSGFVSTTIPQAAGIQSSTLIRPGQGNVTYNVNVSTLNANREAGRVIVDSIRQFNRTSGPAGISTNPRL